MRDKYAPQPPKEKTARPPTPQEGLQAQPKAPLPPPSHPRTDMPRDTPPPPKPKPKTKARGAGGGGCKYKAGENVYVVSCDKGVWGIEHGKEALAAGGPPPKGKHG